MNLVDQYNRLYEKTGYAEPVCTGNPDKWVPILESFNTLGKNLSVVDLGCGRGYYLRKLREMGHRVFGVEQSSVCCGKYLLDIPNRNSTLENFITTNNETYDVVLSTDVLEHIPEKEIDKILDGISKLSNVALLGITNSSDKDEIDGTELHLCIHPIDWWIKQLKKYYSDVILVPDKVSYRNEYFLLRCEKNDIKKKEPDKYGLSITTYIGPQTHPNRINIFLTSVYSLISSGFDGQITIVDDASITKTHLEKLVDLKNKIEIIRRPKNTTLAQCKNQSIDSLRGCRYLFLCDDDMIYNGRWWYLYINANKQTNIQHFCYYVPQVYHNPPATIEKYKGVDLLKHEELNGCMMFVTDTVIKEVGKFVDYPRKGWLEHPFYTQRCVEKKMCPFYCDVSNSRDYIRLNRASYECKSVVI